MFDFGNEGAGEKIKKIAKIYFWIITVIAIIAVIATIFSLLGQNRYGGGGGGYFLGGLLVGVIYILAAYVSAIFIYGFGALIEINFQNKTELSRVVRELEAIKDKIPTSITIVKEKITE